MANQPQYGGVYTHELSVGHIVDGQYIIMNLNYHYRAGRVDVEHGVQNIVNRNTHLDSKSLFGVWDSVRLEAI